MFYGWRVVIGACTAQMFVAGFFTYSVSLLVLPVREEFGVSLEQVMYSLTFGTIFGLFMTPMAGILIDRFSTRALMVIGTLTYAVGLWGLAQSQSIWQYIMIFGFTMALANALCGSIIGSAVVSRWFTKSRGRALGITALGTSVGGVVIPLLLRGLMSEQGWRGSLEYLAALVLLLMLPVVAYTIRSTPLAVGLIPEIDDSSAAPAATVAPERSLSLRDILRNPAYWYLGFSIGILFSTYSAMLANITPYAINLGQAESKAATLITTIAITGFIGKLLFGFAADKFDLKVALWASQCLVLIGLLTLASEPSYPVTILASSAMGLAAGGMLPVWASMMARIFGLMSYGRAMGFMGPLLTLCILPGFALVGRLYDMTGSYTTVLLAFSGAIVVAILLLIPLRLNDSK